MTFDESQGYVVLATLATPLVATLLILLTPSSSKTLIRYIALLTSTVMLGLSCYIFVAYQVNESLDQFQMHLRWDWIENVGFLKEDGITLYLAIDGISALMTLLTGVVPAKPVELGVWPLLAAVAGEVMLGLALGFVTRMAFAAVEMAGRIISTEIGLSASPGMGVPGA